MCSRALHFQEYTVKTRPTWDEYFLSIAEVVATRAACTRAQVGAVVVKDNRIIGTGYNGALPGEIECTEGGCPRGKMSKEEVKPGSDYGNCISLHAEVNALAYSITNTEGATIYTTREPCDWCAKVIAANGIARVVVSP